MYAMLVHSLRDVLREYLNVPSTTLKAASDAIVASPSGIAIGERQKHDDSSASKRL